MISREQAAEIVLRKLNRDPAEDQEEFVVTAVRAKDYGWVVFFDSKRFLETGETRYAIAGNGPVVVEHDGSMHPLSTGRPSEQVIAEYEAKRAGRGTR